MNDTDPAGGLRRRPRAAGQRRARVLAAALAGIAVLAAGCGGKAAAPGSPQYQKALTWAQCLRANGEPDWPDPASFGIFTNQAFSFADSTVNPASPQFVHATDACKSLQSGLLQWSGAIPDRVYIQLAGAQETELLDKALKVAVCMRAHGITNFPDPTPQDLRVFVPPAGGVEIGYVLGSFPHADTETPFFYAAEAACNYPFGGPFAGPGGGP
jgi:hypothetical protein